MARRSRGNGTVYRRGNVWWLQYFVGGRHLNESSGSTEEGEARRQLKVNVGETAAGRAILPGRATVGDLCALVIDDYRLRELRSMAFRTPEKSPQRFFAGRNRRPWDSTLSLKAESPS